MLLQSVHLLLGITLVSDNAASLHRVDELLRFELRAAEEMDDSRPEIAFALHVSRRRCGPELRSQLASQLDQINFFWQHECVCTSFH